MAWLAVNKDGTERIYDYELDRHIGIVTHYDKQLISYDDYKNKRSDFWTTKFTHDVPKQGIYSIDIMLPKGSIEKLLGVVLTWEDDPVEI